jgi:DNA modification methylase
MVTRNRELRVEYRAVESLIPYARNARTHSDEQVAQVAASIREFGWTNPILVDGEDGVIAGHARLLAARKLGLNEVPVIELSGMSETQKRAYILADNRLALNAGWDEELLSLELADLKGLGAELDLLGFSERELQELLDKLDREGGLTDPDEVPPLPEEPVSKPGDLWLLGDHRLLCGDATDSHDVAIVMDGQKARLMATDPPYLVDYTAKESPPSNAHGPKAPARNWDEYKDPESAVSFYVDFINAALPHLVDRAPIYQWHANTRQSLVDEAWKQTGLLAHQVIIWVKTRGVLTRSHYMWQHEPCMYGWQQGKMPSLKPPSNGTTVWHVDQKGEQDGIHPTQKPVELFKRPLLYHTKPGDLCYEPFLGSGTCLIAAEMTERRCFAIDQEPSYVDVAVKRWEDFTGKKAQKA